MAGAGADTPIYADLFFPIYGIDVSTALEMQNPDSTPLGINVRAFEPSTNRARGGSRPGLSQYIAQQLPLSYSSGSRGIQHLQIVVDPQATALGASFVDSPDTYWTIIIPNIGAPYLLADLSWDTTGPQGSGYHTNSSKKRKYPQLVLKANNQTKTAGTEFTWNGSEYTIVHGALKPGDSIFTVAFRSDGADTGAAVGTYPIIASNAVFRLSNAPGYQVVYQQGTMTVKNSIGFLQGTANGFDNSSNPALAFNDPVDAGNLLVVFWATNFGHVTSVHDSLGNTYTKAGQAGGSAFSMECWYCISGASGSNTVTVVCGGNAIGLAILEYEGLNASSPLDTFVPNSNPGDNSVHTGAVNVSQANNNLIIGCFAQTFDVETFAVGSAAFSLRANFNDGNNFCGIYVEDYIDAAGATDMTGTLSGGGNLNGNAAIGISFKP